jgi:type I restriction enzyme R subunit
VFSFHQPATLGRWIREIVEHPSAPTLRARRRQMPPLDLGGLWEVQTKAVRNLEGNYSGRLVID